MSRKATKPIVLVLVFIGALFIFSSIMNKENKDQTTTMESASLPVMQFVYNGMVLNELHGYTNEMDMLSMRDGLMPLNDERQLNVEIATYGNKIDNISYNSSTCLRISTACICRRLQPKHRECRFVNRCCTRQLCCCVKFWNLQGYAVFCHKAYL